MNKEVNAPAERFRLAEENGVCPECGAQMDEIDRLNEAGCVFIWLECSRDGCDGRWLQRKGCFEAIGA
jgi:hypothetical protein